MFTIFKGNEFKSKKKPSKLIGRAIFKLNFI